MKKKIFVTGHKGMFGSALVRQLIKNKRNKIILEERKKLNLEKFNEVDNFFAKNKPDIVFMAAAKVGGIMANIKYPVDFFLKNSTIQNNIFYCAFKYKVKRLIFLGSSCMYPKGINKKIREEDVLTGLPEDTNKAYAIAKISGLVLCESFNRQFFKGKKKFRCIVPPNLFGPNDNYDGNDSHVIAALIKKFSHAVKNKKKSVEIWGSGNPRREFLHVDDAAKATIIISELSDKKFQKLIGKKISHINLSYGIDYKVKKIVDIIKKISNFKGKIKYNKKFPDGVNRKLLSDNLCKKLKIFKNYNLYEKLEKVYKEYN